MAREESWKAVAQEDDVVTFQVTELGHNGANGERTEQLTLAALAEMLNLGGLSITVDELRQMKIVGTPSPMRFRKHTVGAGRFTIQLAQYGRTRRGGAAWLPRSLFPGAAPPLSRSRPGRVSADCSR